MSHFGRPDFEYPQLCKIFGMKSVQRASYYSANKLRFLETLLSLCLEHINASFHTLSKDSELF